MAELNGIIPVDKPPGLTSFDVIRKLRKKFGKIKIGHMGTLDPMAVGVLPILLGSATKFQVFAQENEKEYIAKLKFGILTDTLDIEGKILKNEKTKFNKNTVLKILKQFIGELSQLPPMYSAVKINGKKLYELARLGEKVERRERPVTIYSLELLNFDEQNQEAQIKILCSKGTYIRSLCLNIAEELGSFATMTELIRIKSNGFSLKNCFKLEEIKNLSINEVSDRNFFEIDYLFKNLKPIFITESQALRFKNGGELSIERLEINFEIQNSQILKIYFENNFVGIGKVDFKSASVRVLKCK